MAGCARRTEQDEAERSLQSESPGRFDTASALPDAPDGYQVIRRAGTSGRALLTWYPAARSATALVRDILNRLSGYFGKQPLALAA
jgi:hypothetical protein